MKSKVLHVAIVVLLLTVGILYKNSNTIITTNSRMFKEPNIENNDSKKQVSTRDLALLASLVYEDVPNESNYTYGNNSQKTNQNGCQVSNNGTVTSNNESKKCNFSFYNNSWYKRSGFDVLKYVEGMSRRKLNGFTALATAVPEDGQLYYLFDYADTSEASDWKIVHAKTTPSSAISDNGGVFDAITFKKDDNYVIAYRGTDFPDVIEWIQDILYASGVHKQARLAYEYAQSEYERIITENKENPNFKVYVTGHSLGAYLAQVGGAAITHYDIEKRGGTSNLQKVVYFNGMGITALGLDTSDDFVDTMIKDLKILSTTDTSGKASSISTNPLNYNKDIKGSGRLVLYRVEGDPVSEFGVHLGEIVKIQPALDSINYHVGSHSVIVSGSISSYASTIPTNIENRIESLVNNGLAGSIEEGRAKFTNSISNMVSNIVKFANTSVNTNSYKLENLPNELKGFTATRKTVSGLINFLFESPKLALISGIVERANIGHETDSFACIIDGKNGIPKLTGRILNANTHAKVTSGTTDGNITQNTSFVFNGIINNNGENQAGNLKIAIDATDGCARTYTWYKQYSRGMAATPDPNNWELIDNNNKDEYEIIDSNENGTDFYKVVVTYGNYFTNQIINDGKYMDNNDLDSEDKGQVEHIFVIRNKRTPASCGFLNSKGEGITTLSTGKNSTTKLKAFCSGISVKNTSDNLGNHIYFNNLFSPYTYKFEKCSTSSCDITVNSKSNNIVKNATFRFDSYISEMYDAGGNKVNTEKLKLSYY